jgi:hypothetical protein
MGRANAKCSRGQQERFPNAADLALCIEAARANGALTPHSETSSNAAAMNLIFIQARQSESRLTCREISPL